MKSSQVISVFEVIGNSVHTRDAANRLLRDAITTDVRNKYILLDFSHVDFVSRSFADELYFRIELLSTKFNTSITRQNMAKSVSQVFEAVKRTQHISRNQYQTIPVQKFTSKRDLNFNLVSI